MSDFQNLARQSSGVERPLKEIDDTINRDWNKLCSPKVKSPGTINHRASEWSAILEFADSGQPPPKDRLRAVASRSLLAPLQVKGEPANRKFSPHTPSPLTTVAINVPASIRLVALESSKHASSCVKRKLPGLSSPKLRKRHKTKALSSKQNTATAQGEETSAESIIISNLSLIADDQRLEEFLDPHRNKFIYSPLAQFLVHSRVWIDPEVEGYTGSGSPATSQLLKLIPPGHLTYYIGAFFESIGLNPRPKSNSRTDLSRTRGVVFVGRDNVAKTVGILSRKLQECDTRDPLSQVVVLPEDFLTFPPSSSQQLEKGIIWKSDQEIGRI
jgi:hypothetical protein